MNVRLGVLLLAVPIAAPAVPLGKAPTYVYGTAVSCPMPAGASVLSLESEKITLEIPSLPDLGTEGVSPAAAEVEYVLYNPSDEEVSLGFFLPCGIKARYCTAEDFAALDYTIETDGARVQPKERYSYVGTYTGTPDFQVGVECIQNGGEEFYSADSPVTEYVFSIAVPEEKAGEPITLAVTPVCNPRNTRLLSDCRMSTAIVNGDLRLCFDLEGRNGEAVKLYAVGQKPSALRCGVYTDRLCTEAAEASVQYDETGTDFKSFAMRGYSAGIPVSEADWLCGFSQMLAGNTGEGGVVYVPPKLSPDAFMRWFEYGVTVPAKGSVTHTVKMPIFPAVLGDSYEYQLSLSSAQQFSAVKDFRLAVETPYFVTGSTLEFTLDEAGSAHAYTYTRDSLPCGELTFTVRREEEALAEPSPSGLSPSVKLAIVILCVVVTGGIAAVAGWLISSRKKKK